MQTTTIGVFHNQVDAEGAISELKALGVRDAEVSYVAMDDDTVVTTDGAGNSVAGGTVSGATAGGIVGAIAGLAVANGILPGLGSLFVAGPVAAALGLTGAAATTAAGAMTGAAAGGLIGALSSLGVDSRDARIYEDSLRRGGILIITRSSIATGIRNVFSKYRADEIREYHPATV
jgi:hypothetical protein